MGLVHRGASITPDKLELAQGWTSLHPWAQGRLVVDKIAEYRFDDPEGEVGVETILWRLDDGEVCQVPFTYRAAPLAGAEEHLIGTTEHSVLGTRWVYDGCADPVWAQTLVGAILTGGRQEQMWFERDGQRIDVPARMQVWGSGEPGAEVPRLEPLGAVRHDAATTVSTWGGLQLRLVRAVGEPVEGEAVLRGRVGEEDRTYVLAALARA